MLSMLHEILWEGADWKQCSFTDLLNDGAVKVELVEFIIIQAKIS